MNYDLIIFGFNELGLILCYELSKYNFKIALIDEGRNFSKNYLNKDSIIIYNGVSNFTDKNLNDKSCYEFVKKICENFAIKNEEINFKFKSEKQEYISENCLILNLTNIVDVFYNVAYENSVDFIFDKGFRDIVKVKDEFYIGGRDNELSSKAFVDTRNFKNYSYVSKTYTLSLKFNKYFNEVVGFKKEEYCIIFYKNFIGNIKVDIISEIGFKISDVEAIREFVDDFSQDKIIVKQIEYLKFSLFDKFTSNELMLNKSYFGFNGIFYGAKEVVENLKSRFKLVLKNNIEFKNKVENNNEDIKFNNLVCYCNLLSEGEVIEILDKSHIKTLNDLLDRVECKFNNCIDCYDKFCSIIINHTGCSLQKVLDDNVLRVKNFNEI